MVKGNGGGGGGVRGGEGGGRGMSMCNEVLQVSTPEESCRVCCAGVWLLLGAHASSAETSRTGRQGDRTGRGSEVLSHQA